jgi:hypothetical protein
MELTIEPEMHCSIYVEDESIFVDYNPHLYVNGETVKVTSLVGDTASCVRVNHSKHPFGEDVHIDDLTPTYSPDYKLLMEILSKDVIGELETTRFPYFCEIPMAIKLLVLQQDTHWQSMLADAAESLDKEIDISAEVDMSDSDAEALEQIDYMFDVISGNWRPGVHHPDVESWHRDGEWLDTSEPAPSVAHTSIPNRVSTNLDIEQPKKAIHAVLLADPQKPLSDAATELLCILGGMKIRKDAIRKAFDNLPSDKITKALTAHFAKNKPLKQYSEII